MPITSIYFYFSSDSTFHPKKCVLNFGKFAGDWNNIFWLTQRVEWKLVSFIQKFPYHLHFSRIFQISTFLVEWKNAPNPRACNINRLLWRLARIFLTADHSVFEQLNYNTVEFERSSLLDKYRTSVLIKIYCRSEAVNRNYIRERIINGKVILLTKESKLKRKQNETKNYNNLSRRYIYTHIVTVGNPPFRRVDGGIKVLRACLQAGRVTLVLGLPKRSHISSFSRVTLAER